MMVTTRLSSGAASLILLLPSRSAESWAFPVLAGWRGLFSLSVVGVEGNGDPHSIQNFALGKLMVPQCGQTTRRFPHSRQNFAVGGF